MKEILASSLLVLTTPALAMQAATSEQVLCTGQVVVVARVKGGTSEDCRLSAAAPCSPDDLMRLSVTVEEVLAVRKDADPVKDRAYDPSLTPRHVSELIGQILDLNVQAIAGSWVTTIDGDRGSGNGDDLDSPIDAPLTDADIRRRYDGKSFIFTIHFSLNPGEPYWATAWSMSSRKWVNGSLRRRAGNGCPAMVAASGEVSGRRMMGDSPYRRALISRLEVQFAKVFETGPDWLTVRYGLVRARELNPDLDDASWRKITTEVDNTLASIITTKGTGLDLQLRTIFDTLSTSELRRLLGMFTDPALKKFITAMINADRADDSIKAFPQAMRSVLEKHGLKVPQ
jgi:hypothetical protein